MRRLERCQVERREECQVILIVLVAMLQVTTDAEARWVMIGAKSGQATLEPISFASRADCESFANMIPKGNTAGRCIDAANAASRGGLSAQPTPPRESAHPDPAS